MPREDVPYPMSSQICSIRERIAELQDEINGLLATINSVGGDGQKDIKLLSDNAALSITSDPVQHEIHLDLDTSQLPAASVSSVNGQTGTVVLDGDDLDGVTPGNSVNDDISALQTADGTLQGNINAEALARQNADSTLQGNINTVSAGIPATAAAAVAADPTVAQHSSDIAALQAADSGNVKLAGSQTIPGQKTFGAVVTAPFFEGNDVNYQVRKTASANNVTAYQDRIIYDNGNSRWSALDRLQQATDKSKEWQIHLRAEDSNSDVVPIKAKVAADGTTQVIAVDPPSGDTSQKVVTTNWISQTGNSSPNNVVHRSGNETVLGSKDIPILFTTYERSTETNPNAKTMIYYDLGSLPGTYNIQINLEVCGRGHWRQLYIQIYDVNSVVRGENNITGTDDGLVVIRDSTNAYIGYIGTQNEFPDVKIKYCQYRGTLRGYTKNITDVTGDTNYTAEPIGHVTP